MEHRRHGLITASVQGGLPVDCPGHDNCAFKSFLCRHGWSRSRMTGLFSKIIDGLAIWFGCGLSPIAPGTIGTLGAIPLVYLFSHFTSETYAIATFTFVVAAVLVAHFYERGDSDHDPKEFVMDEVAGF